MSSLLKINDENAELVGRPIFNKIIHSFLNKDREEFIQQFPYLNDWMTVEIFDEAVVVLNRLGELLSTEYSDHSKSKNGHTLVWKVKYKNDDKKVDWKLYLDDSQDSVMVNGFEFDR